MSSRQIMPDQEYNRNQRAEAATDEDEPVTAEACARVKVRGTHNDAMVEASQAEWEAGVRLDASVNDGVVPPKASGVSRKSCVRLFDAAKSITPAADTESELNGLIAECRLLMREVAYASACLTYDPEDRIRFLSAAQGLALTGARVGKTVGMLRSGGGQKVETRRHELVYIRAASVQAVSGQASTTLPPGPEAES